MNRTLEIEVGEVEESSPTQDFEAGPVLSRHNQDSVRWTAREGKEFTVCFNHDEGSPFPESCFPVTFQQPASSGAVKPRIDIGDYHYEILEGKVDSNDPKCRKGAGTKSQKVRIKP